LGTETRFQSYLSKQSCVQPLHGSQVYT